LPSSPVDGSLGGMRASDCDGGRDPGPRKNRPFQRVLALLAGALLCVSGVGPGCKTSCDNGDDSDDPPVVYDGGSRDEALTYYESDSWDGRYLRFPPQRTYDFVHGLGRPPTAVMSYVGFSETPLGTNGNGNVSIAAGNEVIIEWVDDSIIRVRNDTCETFYLRVVALGPNDAATDIDSNAAGGGAG
jgi:hypothetical protein